MTARKSARKSVGRPFKKGENGGARGPKKGAPNAGRPPVAFAQACAALQRGVILEKCIAVLEAKGRKPGDPAWEWAAAYVSRYGEREVTKHVDLTTDGDPLTLPLRERIAHIKALIGGAPCS